MSSKGSSWSAADAYTASFARLCAGSVNGLLDALPPGETLLDVGTGTGTVLCRALERGWDAAGVDPSPEMLDLAAAVAPSDRLHRGELPPAGSRLAPEVDFERTPHGVKRLCQESGLEVELATELSWTFSITPSDLWSTRPPI